MKNQKQKTKQKPSKPQKSLDCPVVDIKGSKIDTLSLSSGVFDGVVNIPLLHQAVTMYRAAQREGRASTKTRSEVRGGGKKPWRQKGTGRARVGSIRSPLWRGGGIIFGPHPRDFSRDLPQKMRRGALRSSLNEKFLDDNLIVINEIKLDKPRTKEFVGFLKSVGIKEDESAIAILDKLDKNIKLSSRNIPNLSVRTANNFNALDILSHKKLIIQESALKNLMKSLQ